MNADITKTGRPMMGLPVLLNLIGQLSADRDLHQL